MNTSAVIPFVFQQNQVRALTIDGDPWFVARDVCDVLELEHITNALAGLDEDELTVEKLQSGGQEREMKLISESGLYTLIIRSNKPQAKPFRKWVTSEVLPSIRKHGFYTDGLATVTATPTEEAQALALTREGERVCRELEIGVRVARAAGVKGRRQMAEVGGAIAASRLGVDPFRYFGLDFERLYPSLTGAASEVGSLIDRFVAELFFFEPEGASSLPLKEVYASFCRWFADRVDHRLKGLPSRRALSRELRRAGVDVRLASSYYHAFGLRRRLEVRQ